MSSLSAGIRRRPALWISLGWIALLVLAQAALRFVPQTDILNLRDALVGPSFQHPFGTDELGRDVLRRVLLGTGTSLFISVFAATGAGIIGTFIGLAAALQGGLMDRAVGVVVDLFWSIPLAVFVVLAIGILGPSPLIIVVTLLLVNWVSPARTIRAAALQQVRAPFMVAARARGASGMVLLWTDLLPNVAPVVTATTVFSVAEVIALETGLAFLGLGVPPPTPSLGRSLAEATQYLQSSPWPAFGAVFMLATTILALAVIARASQQRPGINHE